MNQEQAPPLALRAKLVAPRKKPAAYPEPFRSRMAGCEKKSLGDALGITNFGVNLTRLEPGGESALLHRHTARDEFIYVLEGMPTLVTDRGEQVLYPGDCAGFPAGGIAHHLFNRGSGDVLYLEVGDRSSPDGREYPADDLRAETEADGSCSFSHKDGRPYP